MSEAEFKETMNTPINPEPVKSPTESYNQPEPTFGFSPYAEQINGRFAMIGFIGMLVLEFFTRQDFFTWLGLR